MRENKKSSARDGGKGERCVFKLRPVCGDATLFMYLAYFNIFVKYLLYPL